MDEGWIVIARKANEHPCLEAFDARGVWEKLLLLAAYRPHTVRLAGQMVDLERGQLAVSVSAMAEKGGISRQRMRTIIKTFTTQGMLQVDQAKGHAFSVITICNYGTYQDKPEGSNQASNQAPTKLQPSSNQQRELRNKETRDSEPESESLPEESPQDAAPKARRARSQASYAAEFEAVWKSYPLRDEDKGDKLGCYRLWQTAARTSDASAIAASARQWSAEQTANPYRIGLRRWLKDKHYLRPPPVYRPNDGEHSDPIGEADRAFKSMTRKMNGNDHAQEFTGTHSVVPYRPAPDLRGWVESDDGTDDVADWALCGGPTGHPPGHA